MAEPQPTRQSVATRVENPFGNAGTQSQVRLNGALVSVEQQRAIAEIQARMIVARSSPRDPIASMEQILNECTRPTLAEKAEYAYQRGGTDIYGPTIRLAEVLARGWGNIACGVKELSRDEGYSECVAYCWDMQTGFLDERQFQVRHWRDTKSGGYKITESRDIDELVLNLGARRKRACILTVIPGDVVEAAIEQCRKTLQANADTSPETLKKLEASFAQFGVTKKHIETFIQRKLEAIRPAQLVRLRQIFNSLRDGMSNASDWFGAGAQVRDAEIDEGKPTDDKGSASTTTTSDAGGGGQRNTGATGPGQQQTASRDTDERQQQPTADKFEAYVVDHMGEAVGEGEIFSDPGQWIDAYHNLIDNAFPADTAAIIESNRETVAWLLAKMPGLSKTKQLTEDGSRPAKSDAERRGGIEEKSFIQAVEVPTRGQSQRDMKGYVEAVRKSVSAEIVDADSGAKWLARNEPIMSKLPPATRASAMQAYNARLDALGLGSGKAAEEDDSTAAQQQQQQQTSGETAEQDHPDRRQFELWLSDIGNVPSSNILDSYLSNKAYTAMLARFERERPQFAESLKTAVDAKRSELQRLGR